MALRAAVILLAVKAVVWLVALSSGTSGGVLAPLLILGGAAGCIAGLWLPGSAGFWAIIGMAGIMSGAMRAALTGAIFAAELTGRLDAVTGVVAALGFSSWVCFACIGSPVPPEKLASSGRQLTTETPSNTRATQ